DPDVATESFGTPSAIDKSPMDFDNENPSPPMTEGVASKVSLEEEVAAMGPRLSKKRRRRVNDEADANTPPKVLRKYYASVHPEQSTRGGKSLPTMGLAADSTFVTPADTKGVSDPDLLSYAKPQPHPEQSMTQSFKISTKNVATMEVQDTYSAESAGSGKSTSSPSMVGSPGGIYQPGWGVTNSCRLDTLDSCQDVAMGLQLSLHFEKEVRLLKKAIAQIARRDQRIQVREEEIKKLDQEVQDLQVSNDQLTQQVLTLQTQVTGEERIRAAFEEFKKYEDDRVEKRYVEMEARLDVLSIDFDEELYPYMLTAFANVMSVGIAEGMGEGLAHGIEHGKVGRDLDVVEAYDPEANIKYLQVLQELKDLKYPIVDQLEGLKDAPIEVIMASLHLESDSGEDAPKWIRDLHPSTSQLKIHVYPEVHDPRDPWAVKEEMLLEEAIAAIVSCTEKKKRLRVVCRTHGVGSAHHARSDGVPVSVPTVAP
nr:transposase (putative), gypsy type [Tanacetum cinerariifolium]